MKDLQQSIHDILYGYVKADSTSNTPNEKKAERFFLQHFAAQPYFQAHPDLLGAYPIPNDPLGRAAVWAMVRGKGPDTVVLIHHNDVVSVEDYKLLREYAYSPDELNEKLWEIRDSLSPEAERDLESGGWLFGRGVCDMKGGGAIQMALLSEYAKERDFQGNVIVLGVPDEENLSAGMRAGVELLCGLQEKYGLRYRLMINSEPHQRKSPDEVVFSYGSIGKVMPFVYVRGCLAHAGKVFEGLNPVNIMSEIVRRTEVNMELSDAVGSEAAPPPTWLYLHENKTAYDVSMPLAVNGCLSVLTCNRYPADVMRALRRICEQAFDAVLADMERNHAVFLQKTRRPQSPLPWKTRVVDFGELCREAVEAHGAAFESAYRAELQRLGREVREGGVSLISANFKLVDLVYDYIDDLSPRVVIGLVPPYYPNVSNATHYADDPFAARLHETLSGFALREFGQRCTKELFYTGISDLSYSCVTDAEEIARELENSMPFYPSLYQLPLSAIERISMPCVNIGPWGKDFHKLTERVLKEDLYIRTPRIADFAVRHALSAFSGVAETTG